MTSPTLTRWVVVDWLDCQGDAEDWTPVTDLDAKPCRITTVGILVEPAVRPDHLTVALSAYDLDDPERTPQVSQVCHIPRAQVLGVRTLGFADVPPTFCPVLSFPHS